MTIRVLGQERRPAFVKCLRQAVRNTEQKAITLSSPSASKEGFHLPNLQIRKQRSKTMRLREGWHG
jgi:hypothetical protein